MDSSLITQGIEIVSKAIAADGEGDFERALALYRDALARFTLGLKYEKNEARKKLVIERVEGYMKRAEELSDYLKKQAELGPSGGAGGAAVKKPGEGDDEPDAEKKKLRGALSSAIVSEKPNVKWEDVAGLENAKESLKEVSRTKVKTTLTKQFVAAVGVVVTCFFASVCSFASFHWNATMPDYRDTHSLTCLLACWLSRLDSSTHDSDGHSPRQVSAAIHWQATTLQGYSAIWSSWNGKGTIERMYRRLCLRCSFFAWTQPFCFRRSFVTPLLLRYYYYYSRISPRRLRPKPIRHFLVSVVPT